MQVMAGGYWFNLVMVNWQLGDRDEAQRWYEESVAWLDQKTQFPLLAEAHRERAEAEELMGFSRQPKEPFGGSDARSTEAPVESGTEQNAAPAE